MVEKRKRKKDFYDQRSKTFEIHVSNGDGGVCAQSFLQKRTVSVEAIHELPF